MRRELEVMFPGGFPNREDIVCAHCGLGQSDTVRHNYAYQSCDCPGHMKTILKGFDEMPDLAQRLEGFEAWLEREPCSNDGHCRVLSQISRMCPACRLRQVFFLYVYSHRSETYNA